MRKGLFSAAVTGLAAAVTAAVAVVTAPAFAGTHAGVHAYNQPVCGREWVPVELPHGNYSIVLNAQDGQSCVAVERHHDNWDITSKGPATAGHYWQMPHEMWGEAFGRYSCWAGPSGTSPASRCMRFPVQASHDGTPVFSVLYWPHGYSWGNASLDIWFFREPVTPQQATLSDGTELMVWLGRPGIPLSDYVGAHYASAKIDGQRWYVMGWLTCPHGVCHHYIAFLAYHQTQHEAALWLNPFFRYAEHLRLLSPSWYLTSVDWGYEMNCQCTNILTTYANLSGIPTYAQMTSIRSGAKS